MSCTLAACHTGMPVGLALLGSILTTPEAAA